MMISVATSITPSDVAGKVWEGTFPNRFACGKDGLNDRQMRHFHRLAKYIEDPVSYLVEDS